MSPFGIAGAAATMIIAAVTLYFQFTDPVFRAGVVGVAIYYAVMMAYFLLVGRHKLILSPEEEFARDQGHGRIQDPLNALIAERGSPALPTSPPQVSPMDAPVIKTAADAAAYRARAATCPS